MALGCQKLMQLVGLLSVDWYLSHAEWLDDVTSGGYQRYYEEMYGNR